MCSALCRFGDCAAMGSFFATALYAVTALTQYVRRRTTSVGGMSSPSLLKPVVVVVGYCAACCTKIALIVLPLLYAALPLYDTTLCGAAAHVSRVSANNPAMMTVVPACTRLLGLLHAANCLAAGAATAILIGASHPVQIIVCALAALLGGGLMAAPVLCAMRVTMLAHAAGEDGKHYRKIYGDLIAK